MNTKLTLNISEVIVAKAERVAKRRKTSVSQLVEDFLNKISEEKKESSIVDFLIKNAPEKKTVPGTEKSIITAYLKKNMAIKVFVDTNIIAALIETELFYNKGY